MDKDKSPLDGIEEEELTQLKLCELDDNERMFIQSYMRCRNAPRAYREAGLAQRGSTGAQGAARLLRRDDIQDIIKALIGQRMRRLTVTPQRIEEELAKVAFATLGAGLTVQADGSVYMDATAMDDADLAGIASFECEIEQRPGDDPDSPRSVLKMKAKLWPKVEALGKLAQIHKMISGDVNVAVQVDVADEIRRHRRERAGLAAEGASE